MVGPRGIPRATNRSRWTRRITAVVRGNPITQCPCGMDPLIRRSDRRRIREAIPFLDWKEIASVAQHGIRNGLRLLRSHELDRLLQSPGL